MLEGETEPTEQQGTNKETENKEPKIKQRKRKQILLRGQLTLKQMLALTNNTAKPRTDVESIIKNRETEKRDNIEDEKETDPIVKNQVEKAKKQEKQEKQE